MQSVSNYAQGGDVWMQGGDECVRSHMGMRMQRPSWYESRQTRV